MGNEGPSKHTLEETLDVFTQRDVSGTPLTTSEVADALGCARRTAYNKLEALTERGDLETKKVGARGRVWWRPTATPSRSSDTALERAQFQELVEAVTDYAIFVLDADGIVQTWNEGAKQTKGYDEDEIVGRHFSVFYTEEDCEAGRPERNLEAAKRRGRVEDEGWRVRKDGTTFWANVTITPLYGDDGEHRGFVKITRDTTERHEYEQRIREQKERFEALVSEVKDYAIFMLDPDGVVQTWNEGARRLKGYEEAEIAGQHFSQFYTEEDREAGRPEENLVKAAEQGRVEDEGWRVRKDGTRFWANVTITPLYDDGDLRGFAKVTRDMTERHEYEQRLRAQRDELDELDQINTVIRDIDQALVTATSREEVEQAVCDRLAASDTYSAAWVGEYTDDYETITPRTWAEVSESYLNALQATEGALAEETEKGVGATALRTRTTQTVQSLQNDRSGEPWRERALEEGYASAITVPLVYDEVEYGVLTVYADHESAFDQRKIEVVDELGETISHAIAAVRRKERERTLTALQESTRELLHTESHEEIGDIIVETLTADLGLDDAFVYSFDTAENTLELVGSSHHPGSMAGHLVSLGSDSESPIWTGFVEGEEQVSQSLDPSGRNGEHRTMVVPLGDYGVLTVTSRDGVDFDEKTWNLVELVAATAEAAFDRVENQTNLRERDELLQEQNQRLQRLNRINTIIREVDQGLVQATTREEIQRVVCDQLTKSDRFRFAWIGAADDGDGHLDPVARSGPDRGYLDSIASSFDDGVKEPEPSYTAFQTGDATVVSNVAETLRSGQWRKEAFSREFQSVISVPLQYGDVTYGVLSVYAGQPGVFDEMEQSVFAELGETIANAINAVETKRALLSGRRVELEFRLRDASTSVLGRLAGALDAEVEYRGGIPLSGERVRTFFDVHDATPEQIRDALDESVAVESGQVIGGTDDGHLVEAVVSDSTVVRALTEYGASIRSLTVTEDGMALTVDVPTSVDVRDFVEWFQHRYESAEFVARRERERAPETRDGLYAEVEEYLTDRQLEVLETAYYSGFFVSPRQSTGSDVADLLGVSQPTVSEQLRAAQCKVLDLLLDEGPASD